MRRVRARLYPMSEQFGDWTEKMLELYGIGKYGLIVIGCFIRKNIKMLVIMN